MKAAIFAIYKAKLNTILSHYYSSDQGAKAREHVSRHPDHGMPALLETEVRRFISKRYRRGMLKSHMKSLYEDAFNMLVDMTEYHSLILGKLDVYFIEYTIPCLTFEEVVTLNNPIFICL